MFQTPNHTVKTGGPDRSPSSHTIHHATLSFSFPCITSDACSDQLWVTPASTCLPSSSQSCLEAHLQLPMRQKRFRSDPMVPLLFRQTWMCLGRWQPAMHAKWHCHAKALVDWLSTKPGPFCSTSLVEVRLRCGQATRHTFPQPRLASKSTMFWSMSKESGRRCLALAVLFFSRQDGLTMSASDLRYKAGCSSLNLSLYLSRPRLSSHHRLDSAFQFEKWKSSEHTCAEHGLHSPYQPHAPIPQLPPSSLWTFGGCCPEAQRSGDCSKQWHATKVF